MSAISLRSTAWKLIIVKLSKYKLCSNKGVSEAVASFHNVARLAQPSWAFLCLLMRYLSCSFVAKWTVFRLMS